MFLSRLNGGRAERIPAEARFDEKFDVIVAGFGTAGAIAAITAAEHGVRVAAVEKLNMAGGTATAGGVWGYYYGLPGGRFEAVDAEVDALRRDHFTSDGAFHPDLKGICLEQAFLKRGGALFYESAVTGVWLDEDRQTVLGVRMVTPDGVRDCGCSVLIDATGDGQAAAIAGAAFAEGRESDGKCQPFSSIRAFRRGGGIGLSNFDAGYMKCSDPADLTRGILASNSLHAKSPGEPQDELYWITRLPGLREGRLVECDETLRFAEFMAGKLPPGRALGWGYSNFDSHTQDWALNDRPARDWMVAASLWGKEFAVPLTLGMLTVRGFANLLVAGRALSVDHLMAGLLRMQRCMQKTGEIAGRAAALSVQANCSVREIDSEAFAAELRTSGCLDATLLPPCTFPEMPDVLEELLRGPKPGMAIWQASRNLDRYRGLLLKLLSGSDRHAAANAALALGLAGDEAALPELRRLVREGDDFLPASSRSHNQRRILAAVDLLGRFGCPEDAELLLEKLHSAGEDVQLFTHLLRSLLELGGGLPEFRQRIRQAVSARLDAPDFHCDLLLKNSSHNGQKVFAPLHGSLKQLAEKTYQSWEHRR